jgi:hypothetical protein
MHKQVSEVLQVALDQDSDGNDDISIPSLKKVLRNYPEAFSFLVMQHRIIKGAFLNAQKEYDRKYESFFSEVSKNESSKASVTSIKSKVEELYADILNPLKDRADDLEQKAKLASDMFNVFDKSINALQSLGKLVATEEDFYTRRPN